MKRFIVRHGVYTIIVISAVLTYCLGLVIQRWFPPLGDLTVLSSIEPKVTLLSVIIALGIIQYNYFYNECREVEGRLEKKDFGPLWTDYIKRAEDFRLAVNSPSAPARLTTEQFETLKGALKGMEEAIAKAERFWIDHLHNNLADFSIRFGIIFSIAALILSSVTLDFVYHVWRVSWVNPTFYAAVTFLMSIILIFVYLIILVVLVQNHIRNFQSVDKSQYDQQLAGERSMEAKEILNLLFQRRNHQDILIHTRLNS